MRLSVGAVLSAIGGGVGGAVGVGVGDAVGVGVGEGVGDGVGGKSVKIFWLLTVPAGVVTDTLPVVAPTGTCTVMQLSATEGVLAGVPLKVTADAPVSPLPKICNISPGTPRTGCKFVMVGAP